MKKLLDTTELLWRTLAHSGRVKDALQLGAERIIDFTASDWALLATDLPETHEPRRKRRTFQIIPERCLRKPYHHLAMRTYHTEVEPRRVRKTFELLDSDSTLNIVVDAFPLKNQENRTAGILVTAREINSKKPFSAEDKQFLEEIGRHIANIMNLHRDYRSFRRIVQRIGHDMKAPITAIRNRSHYLMRHIHELSEEIAKRKLEDIRANATELAIMTNHLDVFSEKERDEEPRRTMVFTDVIQKCSKEMRSLFLEKKALPPEPTSFSFLEIPPLFLRKSALERIVQNLLHNTLKYGSDNAGTRAPEVLGVKRKYHYEIIFRDWGIGIQKVEKAKIFSEGYRGAEARKRDVAGQGMGLYIARQLARSELSGDLALTSLREPTEFRLQLPKDLRLKG